MKPRDWLKSYWLLLLPVLLILPGATGFPYPTADAEFSDIAITFYPNLYWLKHSLFDLHTVPFWSPLILSGSPFAANPQSGLHYPFGWPALLYPLPLGINLMVMLHLLWGGIGMVAFLRQLGRSKAAALLGGLAFSTMPKLMAHFGAGHLAIVYAVVWLPWLLWASASKKCRWCAQPGLILGVIFLASPMWAAFSGLLWLAWEVGQLWISGEAAHIHDIAGQNQAFALTVWMKRIAMQVLLAVLLAAPLLLPLAEFTKRSTRIHMQPSDTLLYSLSPSYLMFLPFPHLGSFHEYVYYPGIIVLCLALCALLTAFKKRGIKFWLVVVSLFLLYSMGSNLPLMDWLVRLPGFSLLRVPPRTLFLADAGLVILAAYGLDAILAEAGKRYHLRLALAGLLAYGLVVAAAVWWLHIDPSYTFIWGISGVVLFWVWLEVRLPYKTRATLILLLLVVDLAYVGQSFIRMQPMEDVICQGQPEAEYLAAQPGRFRVYSPSYSIPQQTAVRYGLELADGVDPLHLESYAHYMQDATGVPRTAYVVTVPPYENSSPATDNLGYTPDVDQLQQLGVGYVVSAFPLQIEAQQVEKVGESWIYTLGGVDLPEAISPNERLWQMQGGGMVTIPEMHYPGWRAFVDGERTELLEVEGVMQGLDLPPGNHEIRLVYFPTTMYLGLGVAVVGVMLLRWMTRENDESG